MRVQTDYIHTVVLKLNAEHSNLTSHTYLNNTMTTISSTIIAITLNANSIPRMAITVSSVKYHTTSHPHPHTYNTTHTEPISTLMGSWYKQTHHGFHWYCQSLHKRVQISYTQHCTATT